MSVQVLFIGCEDSSLWAPVCTPSCQRLSGWVVGWASEDLSKVSNLSDDYFIFCCRYVKKYYSDSLVCYFFFNDLSYSNSKDSSNASVPEDFYFSDVGAAECP